MPSKKKKDWKTKHAARLARLLAAKKAPFSVENVRAVIKAAKDFVRSSHWSSQVRCSL